uniref:Transposase Tc1-like domain-containing protein n=1 Tax=Octopus bimaculoides TaxID=37653 RepID=A0A0L8H621_OCTBM
MLIKRTIDRYQETSSIKDQAVPAPPEHLNSSKMLGKKIRRNPRRSMRRMAKKAQTSPRTMRRICKSDLKLSPYKLQKRQLLSTPTNEKRLSRSRLLLNRIKDGTLRNIIFSDEKLFSSTVSQSSK